MKYIIIDNSSNTGKNHIDENGDNCLEEQAALYVSRDNAILVAQSLTTDPAMDWAEWAYIGEVEG